jgi:hypothetical protein
MKDSTEPVRIQRRRFLKNGMQLTLAGTLVGIAGFSVMK